MFHAHALSRRLAAGADPGRAVDRYERVRAPAADTELAAFAVVLEAPREDAPPLRIERRRDGVPRERLDGAPVERERDRARAVDALAGLRRKARHQASAVHSTSFVRVSRS